MGKYISDFARRHSSLEKLISVLIMPCKRNFFLCKNGMNFYSNFRATYELILISAAFRDTQTLLLS